MPSSWQIICSVGRKETSGFLKIGLQTVFSIGELGSCRSKAFARAGACSSEECDHTIMGLPSEGLVTCECIHSVRNVNVHITFSRNTVGR